MMVDMERDLRARWQHKCAVGASINSALGEADPPISICKVERDLRARCRDKCAFGASINIVLGEADPPISTCVNPVVCTTG